MKKQREIYTSPLDALTIGETVECCNAQKTPRGMEESAVTYARENIREHWH